MDRLTKIDKYGHYYTNEKLNDRMQLDEPQTHAYDGKVIDKLAHYEELEEKGLLVELQCKVGDTVGGKEVKEIRIDKAGTLLIFIKGYCECGYSGITTERLNITETHLCNNCEFLFPECNGNDIVFGNGKGNDNVVMCDCYKKQTLKEMEK